METNQTHIPPKGHPSLFDEPATDTPATDTAPAPQQAPGLVISYGSTVIGHAAIEPDASAESEQADDPEKEFRRREYQAKRERRVERYQNRAANAAERSTEAYEASNRAVAGIPFGQPILVGHHSEGRHRNALKRSHAAMDRSCAEQKKAEYWQARAKAAASNHAIFSDDPDASEKLEAKIARLEARQKLMVEANKLCKKNDREGLLNLGFSESQADALLAPPQYSFERRGFQGYQLSNNSANIRRLKDRLKQVQATAEAETTSKQIGEVEIVDNVEENRVQVIFPGKPADNARAYLKSNGFRWSPSAGAWQRHRSSGALYHAERAAELWTAE